MSIARSFIAAREVLGIEVGADIRAIRRAYRKRVAAHPPDRDPETFQEIRSAFELLTDPVASEGALLYKRRPHVPPPPLESEPPPDLVEIHRVLVRYAVRHVTAEDLLGDG